MPGATELYAASRYSCRSASSISASVGVSPRPAPSVEGNAMMRPPFPKVICSRLLGSPCASLSPLGRFSHTSLHRDRKSQASFSPLLNTSTKAFDTFIACHTAYADSMVVIPICRAFPMMMLDLSSTLSTSSITCGHFSRGTTPVPDATTRTYGRKCLNALRPFSWKNSSACSTRVLSSSLNTYFFFFRAGSPLLGVPANSFNCSSVIPVLVFFPSRFLARSAPMSLCCALLFAGIPFTSLLPDLIGSTDIVAPPGMAKCHTAPATSPPSFRGRGPTHIHSSGPPSSSPCPYHIPCITSSPHLLPSARSSLFHQAYADHPV